MTKDDYARAVLQAGRDLGITERGIVIAYATVSVECDWIMYANAKVPDSLNLPHERVGNDGYSVGLFQQQVVWGNGAWWWGDAATCMDPYKSAALFFGRLAKKNYQAATTDIAAGAIAQSIQGSAFPDRYATRMADAQQLYNRIAGSTPGGTVGVSGDPVWLEDVLRPALGDRLKTLPGWKDSGVGGTMGQIWGMIWHHTGNANATAQSIRDGRPDLKGPLSQLHIAQNGTVTIVAVGPCNHAGKGSWAGLPTDAANDRTIGIECAYPRDVNNPGEKWPDAQIISMRDTGAALTQHLGVPVTHNISHMQWAQLGPLGFRQGKTDPWNLDMDWFRGEIQKDMDGFVFPGEHPEITPPATKRFPDDWTDRELMVEILRQLRGPTLNGWDQLGGKSLVDAVAELRKAGA